jgi:hypothetical protein
MRGCGLASETAPRAGSDWPARARAWEQGLLFAIVLCGASTACSQRVLVAVDPDPCTDGGLIGCVPEGLLDGLIGYWRLDDGPGSVTAHDWSGRGNHGTLVELDPASAWVAGRAGLALDVRARGWVLVTPSATVDAIRDRLTISAWVYLDGTIVDWGTAVSRQIGTTLLQHYHISLNQQEQPSLFVTTANAGVLLIAPNRVARATWVHLAGVFDGASARLYVDGAAVGERPLDGTFAPDVTPLVLAGNGNGVGGVVSERFPGRVDEIMLYRRALGEEEIRQLHAGALFVGEPRADAGSRD